MPVSNAMKTHLQGNVTVGVFVKITAKDGDVIRVWNGTRNKIVDGETYNAYPIAPTRLQASNGLKADNLDIVTAYSGLFNAATLRAKKWQGARVEYRILNYRDFTMGYAERRVMFLGKTEVGKHAAKPELDSLSSRLSQPWGRSYNLECDVDELGDDRCTFDLNGFTANGFRARIQAHVVNPVLNRQQFTVALDQAANQGLRARYYTGTSFGTLVYTRDAGMNVDHVWTGTSPAPGLDIRNYSIIFDGKVVFPYSENVTLECEHDDGVRVYWDDMVTPKIDQWGTIGTHSSSPFAVTAGTEYNLKVEYFQSNSAGTHPAFVKLRWSSSSQALEIIPKTALKPPAAVPYPDQFFARGKIKFLNGVNQGVEAQILANEGAALTLYLPLFYTPVDGDDVELTVGCIRTIAVCRDIFANAINNRGFPYLPGRTKLFHIPGS